jgi:hypothetical protein
MEIFKVSMEFLAEKEVAAIERRMDGRPCRAQLVIECTDTANSYERLASKASRHRVLTATTTLAPDTDVRKTLAALQRRIYDQNYVYEVAHTRMHLHFYELGASADLSDARI